MAKNSVANALNNIQASVTRFSRVELCRRDWFVGNDGGGSIVCPCTRDDDCHVDEK